MHNEEIIHTIESTDSRSAKNKAIALLCALLLTCGVIFGYLYLRWRNERIAALNQPTTEEVKSAPSPLADILVDEAIPKGTQATISGTVVNTSQETLKSLAVELECTKREGGIETKTLPIEPNELANGQSGRYSITLPSKEFKSIKVLRLLSGGKSEIPFKQSAGAKRPLEKPSPQKVKIVVIKPERKSGDDYINTPDTPVVIK